MALSREMRLLQNKWHSNQGWPKRLDAIEIHGVRGWTGQRIDFIDFPIIALVGENGAGKSTILQAAASIYRGPLKRMKFASAFFPDTPWERVEKAQIKWWVREGQQTREGRIRKESSRWRGNPDRRERHVENIDLSRIQPVSARVGYFRLAKPQHKEVSSDRFDKDRLTRLSNIMGRPYEIASMSLTNFDSTRSVPVIRHHGVRYSGFHGGAGETTMVELLRSDIPQYSLVVIDEIETSLHARSQRRLMRDLAEICRIREVQIILSTHSPYVLDELPESARLYVWEGAEGREIIKGVSPEFAMTKMDLEQHPECDLYVEDEIAQTLLREILVAHALSAVSRCLIIPYGAASVGQALGQMVRNKKWPRPTCVFLDGDQPSADGCINLPGEDAPERVIFSALQDAGWAGVAERVGRSHSQLVDACSRAMTADNEHEWVRLAADDLTLGGQNLWQAMCAVWARNHLTETQAKPITDAVLSAFS
jgi:predicted ATPase